MPEEKSLEQFKEEFTRDYIDRSIDRLLDLRNAVKKAETVADVGKLIHIEQATVLHDMGIEKKSIKIEDKKADLP